VSLTTVRGRAKVGCDRLVPIGRATGQQNDPLTRDDVVEMATAVEVMGAYSNRSVVSRLRAILAGQKDDRPSSRPHQSRQFQRRLSANEVAELVAAHDEGATQKDLAARFGIYRTTVAAHLDRAGITDRRGAMTPEQVGEAIDLYNEGWSLARIAKHFGVYPTSIYYWLRKDGVTLRPRRGWNS
jgi:transposase-like protein